MTTCRGAGEKSDDQYKAKGGTHGLLPVEDCRPTRLGLFVVSAVINPAHRVKGPDRTALLFGYRPATAPS